MRSSPRSRSISIAQPLALVLLATLWGCEKPKDPSETPVRNGPEVVIEQPGPEPEQPELEPEPDPPADDGLPPGTATEVVATTVPCQSDADCVKDNCCHASGCVDPANAPNCSQVMCTMDCQTGTMDCFGGCLCQDGFCAAELWTGPGG